MFYIVMLCNNTKVAVDTLDSQADAGCILCILSHMRSYIGYKANTRPGLMMMQWCCDAVCILQLQWQESIVGCVDRCIFSINFVCRRHRVSYSAADRADGSWIGIYLDTDLILPLSSRCPLFYVWIWLIFSLLCHWLWIFTRVRHKQILLQCLSASITSTGGSTVELAKITNKMDYIGLYYVIRTEIVPSHRGFKILVWLQHLRHWITVILSNNVLRGCCYP